MVEGRTTRCSRRRQCDPDANERETLGELIDAYIHKYRPGAEAELTFFRRKTLEQAVEHAALAHGDEGRRFSHQRRLTSANLAQALSLLKADLAGIRRCTDFDELIGLVEAKVRAIKGLGELYSYDTALRIGAQKGILPTHVYLHRGTRDGARHLGLNARSRYLTIPELPCELRRLAPHEIEDFLCIFKREMPRFNPRTLSRQNLEV